MRRNAAAQAARDESLEAPVLFDLAAPLESVDVVSEDFVSEPFVSAFESLEPSAESDFPASLLLPFPLSRKSVTYHPSPFRWNAAALISFLSLSFPQEGHLRFGLSLNFWMNSCRSLHPLHSYS